MIVEIYEIYEENWKSVSWNEKLKQKLGFLVSYFNILNTD